MKGLWYRGLLINSQCSLLAGSQQVVSPHVHECGFQDSEEIGFIGGTLLCLAALALEKEGKGYEGCDDEQHSYFVGEPVTVEFIDTLNNIPALVGSNGGIVDIPKRPSVEVAKANVVLAQEAVVVVREVVQPHHHCLILKCIQRLLNEHVARQNNIQMSTVRLPRQRVVLERGIRHIQLIDSVIDESGLVLWPDVQSGQLRTDQI